MSNATLNEAPKPGFWKRILLAIEAMEKTEADYQWDAIHDLKSENEKLNNRVKELEGPSQPQVDFSALSKALVDNPDIRFLRG